MNIFIDCGFYIGDALRKYVADGTVDDTWVIYAFEPSPDIDMKASAGAFKLPIRIRRKAVWTKSGNFAFWTSNRHNAGHLAGMPEHAEKDKVMVKAIDFSAFLKRLPENAYVICSMDIEGAEFAVLEKCLRDHTIDRIKILDVEFHHRFMVEYTPELAQSIIDDLESRGIEVRLKVPLR